MNSKQKKNKEYSHIVNTIQSHREQRCSTVWCELIEFNDPPDKIGL